MENKGFRLRVAIDVTLIAVIGEILMTLVQGFFLFRDIQQVLPALAIMAPLAAGLAALLFLALWLSLGRAESLIRKLDAGEEVSAAERLKARSAFSRLFWIIVAGDVAAFIIGPAVLIAVRSQVLKHAADPMADGLILVLGLAFGLSCATQQVARSELKLLPERRKLAVTELGAIRRDMSVTARILLSVMGSIFLSAVSMGLGGIGMYREYARWVAASSAVDASSSATQSAGASAVGSTSYQDAETRVLLNLAALALGLLAWGGLATSWTIRFLFGQIGTLDSRMREIQGGVSDLTARATIAFKDEIGGLTSNFNGVLGALQALLGSVKDLSRSVAGSSRALDEHANGAEASLRDFEDSSVRVREAVEAQSSSVAASRTVITRMAESIETVTGEVSTQASFVEESSASIEQMVANIASVSRSAEKAGSLTQSLSELSDSGHGVVEATLRGMAEIQSASASVRSIIGSISKIAAQTNLLAMNAAIEAAHAGEAGRGFSVVADEVRNLAETSAKSTRETIDLVRAMDAKITEGSALTGKAGEAFKEIASGVKDASELVQGIARSMAEQSMGAQEILSSVRALTDATERIKELSSDQRGQSSGVQEAMAGIVRSTALIEDAIGIQSRSTKELSRIVGLIFEEAEKNKAATESLDSRIGGFRV